MPPKTRSQKKKEQDPPEPEPPKPQVLQDAENLLEIGQFIAKHFAKKGIQTELNIHLYPD
jgi:hypothetical protein